MSDKLRAAAKAFMEMQNINPSCADFYHETKELHKFSEPCKPLKKYMKVVDALRAALAEPAIKESLTVQRPWVGLTEDEIWTLHDSDSYPSPVEFARAVEAKLRERNGG